MESEADEKSGDAFSKVNNYLCQEFIEVFLL